MLEIRKAKPGDAKDLCKLMSELVGHTCELETLREQLALILADPHYGLFVADDGGRVAGTVMGIACYDLAFNGQKFGIIENVITDADYRGQGVGRRMFEAVEQWAVEQGCAYIQLVSSAYRTGAHQFYEKIGYTREGGFRKRF